MTNKPQTLQQAIVYFSDKDIAHQYLVDLRWSDGVTCPHCQSKEQHSYTTTRKISFHGSATKGFIAMPTSYLVLVAWQEGLTMLREQRKYTLRINVSRIPEIIEGEADFVEHLLGPDS